MLVHEHVTWMASSLRALCETATHMCVCLSPSTKCAGSCHTGVSESGGFTHALANVILAAQQFLQLCPQGPVLPLQLLTCFLFLLQCPCQRQGPSLTLPALCLDPLTLLHCPQHDCLFLGQELPGGRRWGGGNRLAERSVQGSGEEGAAKPRTETDRQTEADTRER